VSFHFVVTNPGTDQGDNEELCGSLNVSIEDVDSEEEGEKACRSNHPAVSLELPLLPLLMTSAETEPEHRQLFRSLTRGGSVTVYFSATVDGAPYALESSTDLRLFGHAWSGSLLLRTQISSTGSDCLSRTSCFE
jgi:hypothetical protein